MGKKVDDIEVSFTLRDGDIYLVNTGVGVSDADFLKSIKAIKSFLRRSVFLEKDTSKKVSNES